MADETEKHIIQILNDSFNVIDARYRQSIESGSPASSSIEESRLIFPKLRSSKTRISEQELRFAFIEQFNKHCEQNNWRAYYSIETPTIRRYSFKDKDPKVDEKGCRSGNIDVCIHDKDRTRICLLEFKALNPDEHSYIKDFFKLNKEKEKDNSIHCFFVQLLKNQDSGTNTNIDNKIKETIGDIFYISHTVENRNTDYYSKAKKSIIIADWNEI